MPLNLDEIVLDKDFSNLLYYLRDMPSMTIRELAFLECGLEDEKDLGDTINYFSNTAKGVLGRANAFSNRIALFGSASFEEKKALMRRIDSEFRKDSPEKYYRGMIETYQQLFDAVQDLREVEGILAQEPHSDHEKVKRYVPEGTVIDARFIADMKDRIIWLNQTYLYRFHRKIIRFAKKLGLDETDVHVDIVSNGNTTLDSFLVDYSSSFNRMVHISDESIGFRILRTSGKGKLAVLLATLHHSLPHEPESQWIIKSGEKGYGDLVVEGPPWGAVLETCRQMFYEYLKKPEEPSFKYKSVVNGNAKSDDDFAFNEIRSKFRKYISFAGFAPYLYDHADIYWHRVVEFDYRKIVADKGNAAESFLERALDFVRAAMAPKQA